MTSSTLAPNVNHSRRPLICGNWKMFHGGPTSVELARSCVAFARAMPKVDVVLAPPFTALAAVADEIDGSPVKLAAQNLYPKDQGAFTGEVSAPFLAACGCAWVIVGHSER
ncbi:MAG TPA: triose-phosphate isomerase, partial [Polyangiaceae bacterium]